MEFEELKKGMIVLYYVEGEDELCFISLVVEDYSVGKEHLDAFELEIGTGMSKWTFGTVAEGDFEHFDIFPLAFFRSPE